MRAAAARVSVVLASVVTSSLVACGDDGGIAPIDATVDAAPGPTSVTFRLAYDSDVPDSIYVQSATGFGGQGWLTVRTPAGVELEILDDCGQCNCDACDPCAVCGVGRPEVAEIRRGEHLDWSWDTRVFGAGTCATTGSACEAAVAVAPGRYLARFCWSTTTDGVGPDHHVGPLTCADETFELVPGAPSPLLVAHEECACG